jgi:drug/metabolite transporter (DMT)-like permease
MYALQTLEASETSLVTLLSPIFALLLGVLFFHAWPRSAEIVGGIAMMVGVAVPAWNLRKTTA